MCVSSFLMIDKIAALDTSNFTAQGEYYGSRIFIFKNFGRDRRDY